MKNPFRSIPLRPVFLTVLALAAAHGLHAQIPTVLTDKIYRGAGVIDLMKNVSGTELSQYFGSTGRLLLGVDVNEDSSGNESSTSQGIAIQNVQLLISTNLGSFSFSDLFTNTTALLTEAGGTTATTYHTLFGQGGSSQVNGSTSGFDLAKFDDVLEVRNVAVAGTISSAKFVINFLQTASGKGSGGNESFFDFSGGFEDFALLTPRDAQVLEAAAAGTTAVSSDVAFSSTTVSSTYYIQPSPTATSPSTTTTTASSPTTATSSTTSSTPTLSTTVTSTESSTSVATASPTPTTSPTSAPTTSTATSAPTTSGATSVAVAAPGAPEPSVLLLLSGAGLALMASLRERLVRRA